MSEKEEFIDEMWKSAGSDSFDPCEPWLEFEDKTESNLNKIEFSDIRTQNEIEDDKRQIELNNKFNKDHFNFLYVNYRDQFVEYTQIIDFIVSDDTYRTNDKYDKLVELGIEIEIEAMSNISKIDPISKELDQLSQEALNCLVVYTDNGDCYPSKYYFKGESDDEWLIDNCIVEKIEYRQYQQQIYYHQLISKQLIASKYYLQSSLSNLKENKVKKVSKSTKITSYSLSITTHLFELLRDENVIATSNVKIAESIANLTGFSKKQAINQFSENAKRENASKLNSQTKALLEKLLNRLK